MLLADTSAWIEFLNATVSVHARRLREAITRREVIVIDPILLEVMAGARRDAIDRTRRLLEAQHHEALTPRLDWMDAAAIYRELRQRGITIRSAMDVLIAAVAIRLGTPILHHDRDFNAISRYTPLSIVTV